MKNIITTALILAACTANKSFAQLDRAGNVTDDGAPPGGGNFMGQLFVGAVVGAILGAAFAKYRDSPEKPFATDGGAIIGGFIGGVAWPFLSIVFK